MWQVRDETPSDYKAIYDLTKCAFAPMPFSDQTEQDVIERLRQQGKLSLSRVVEHEGKLVGHIAFSRMVSDGNVTGWIALGRISVEPNLQKQGIGTSLVNDGIRALRRNKAHGIALVGDSNYYSRFGFVGSPTYAPKREPPEHFQLLRFEAPYPCVQLEFDGAFYGEP